MVEINEAAAGAGLYDLAFYVGAWSIGAISGLLSTCVGHKHRDTWDLLAIGSLSGLFSVAVIGFVCRAAGATLGSEPYFLAIAILVGALGKLGLKLSHYVAFAVLSKAGIDVKEDTGDYKVDDE